MFAKRLLTAGLAAAALFLGANSLHAQGGRIAPDHQVGIGVFVGSGNGVNGGMTFGYAFSPAFQLSIETGANFQTRDGQSSNDYSLGINGRLLFEGTVNPFLQAGFRFGSFSVDNPLDTGLAGLVNADSKDIYLGFGLAYYITPNFGITGMTELFDYNLDSETASFGITSTRLGMEWWFNR